MSVTLMLSVGDLLSMVTGVVAPVSRVWGVVDPARLVMGVEVLAFRFCMEDRHGHVGHVPGAGARGLRQEGGKRRRGRGQDKDAEGVKQKKPRAKPRAKKAQAKNSQASTPKGYGAPRRHRPPRAMAWVDEEPEAEDEADLDLGGAAVQQLAICPLCEGEADATGPEDHVCSTGDDEVVARPDDDTCMAIIGSSCFYISHCSRGYGAIHGT